jgi:hypothetical protein
MPWGGKRMNPLDYGRSFIIGTAPGNEVRFWVESRTQIVNEKTGASEEYVQCASCKSENTFGESDLFIDDNYDFLPVFGTEFGIYFRRRAWLNDNYKSVLKTEAMWQGPRYHLVEGTNPRILDGQQEILEATRDMLPIVAQTDIRDPKTQLRATIEYPVKTMNTCRRIEQHSQDESRQGEVYQVDTGPILFPDLSGKHERLVDGLSLAFVAFNAPHFADFVIEAPTSAAPPEATEASNLRVYHYSEKLTLEAENRLYVSYSPETGG